MPSTSTSLHTVLFIIMPTRIGIKSCMCGRKCCQELAKGLEKYCNVGYAVIFANKTCYFDSYVIMYVVGTHIHT